MITPNIAPRKITGSAAAGLFSAAKSSVRTMERTTNTLVKSPDITKQEKLGINYVQFFGSKKNSKILKKSLKSIRDSLVATFAIAKMLRSEVSKNVKLIGEKTKKKKGLFGLGLGGILGLVSLLANPIVLSALGIGAGLVGGGFLINFLIQNRDQIADFIMNKAKGLYNTLQGLVTEVLRDFLGDRFKDPATRNIEVESEKNIEETMDELLGVDKEGNRINPDLTKGQARVEATKKELERLRAERDELEALGAGRSSKQDEDFEATKKRIKQLETGKSIFDRTDTPFPFNFMQGPLQKEFQRRPAFLKDNEEYLKLSADEKLKKIRGLVGNFRSKGNSMDRILEIYSRAMQPGGEAFGNESKMQQARDIIEFARRDDKNTRRNEGNITPGNFNFDSTPGENTSKINTKISKNDLIEEGNKRGQFTNNNGGESVSQNNFDNNSLNANQVNAKPSLAQAPVKAKSTPTMRYFSNFNEDNIFPSLNKAQFNIV